jgi:hypothetical protein
VAQTYVSPQNRRDFSVTGIQYSFVRVRDVPRWFAIVQGYSLSDANAPEPPRLQDVVVLLDGRVVAPTEEPAQEWPTN